MIPLFVLVISASTVDTADGAAVVEADGFEDAAPPHAARMIVLARREPATANWCVGESCFTWFSDVIADQLRAVLGAA
jgi:hypothetical protein